MSPRRPLLRTRFARHGRVALALTWRQRLVIWAAALVLAAGALTSARAAEMDESVRASLAMRRMGAIRVTLHLRDMPSLQAQAARVASLPMAQRPGALAATMREDFAHRSQAVLERLRALGAQDVQPLWLTHAIAVQLPRSLVEQVAAWPDVARIETDLALRAQQVVRERALPADATARDAATRKFLEQASAARPAAFALPGADRPWVLPEHLIALDASRAWQAGQTGRGTTVAIIDSGVDLRVPGLAQAWRGGAHGWFDPYGEHALPYDGQGHGTLVASLLTGHRGEADAPLAVAPEARFIAARLFDDAGFGRLSAVVRAYQWMLDPDGRPETPDAPHVVNNSWGFAQSSDRCDLRLERVWQAYALAGIPVVFAAGNDGPLPSTSMSPANNPGVIAVGALDADGRLARQSSRGPSACHGPDGLALPFPSLYAPGISVQTLDRAGASMGVTSRSDGTSFAAAVASGALLLLRQAQPEAGVDQLLGAWRQRMRAAADDLPATIVFGAPPVDAQAGAVRPTQRFVVRAADVPIALQAETLAAALPRGVQVSQIEAKDTPGLQPAAAGGYLWQPQDAQAHVALTLVLSDGTRLPLQVAFVPSEPTSRRATRFVGAQRDVPQTIDLKALVGMDVDPTRLQWSQPLRGGRLTRLDDGKLRYQPPRRFLGTDQFVLRGAVPEDLTVKVVVRP